MFTSPYEQPFETALDQLFSAQGRELLCRIGKRQWAGVDEPSLSHWIGPMSETATPFLYREYSTGIVLVESHIVHKGFFGDAARHIAAAARAARNGAGRIVQANVDAARAMRDRSVQIGTRAAQATTEAVHAVYDRAMQFSRDTIAAMSGVVSTTLARLRDKIRQGVEQHVALATMAQRIRELFMDRKVARRIAVTELARARNAGVLRAAQKNGVKFVTWRAYPQACDRCKKLNGVSLPTGSVFHVDPKGGPYSIYFHPPLHPNCRCELIPG